MGGIEGAYLRSNLHNAAPELAAAALLVPSAEAGTGNAAAHMLLVSKRSAMQHIYELLWQAN
jgi:hypothetical protein